MFCGKMEEPKLLLDHEPGASRLVETLILSRPAWNPAPFTVRESHCACILM